MTSRVLVGRDDVVTGFAGALDLAGGGAGQVALLSGPAGVGKTSVVGELSRTARDNGFLIAIAQCDERDQSQPFAPLIGLLRAHLSVLRPLVAGPLHGLVLLLPELGLAAPSIPIDEGEMARVVARAVTAVASESPTVIVIEDLHWADESTCATLGHLGRTAGSLATLLVLTFRAEEAPPEVVSLLATLGRQAYTRAWELAPLRLEETTRLVSHLVGADLPLSRRFLDRIQSITDGNPLFVEEVIGALGIEPGGPLPDQADVDRAPVPRSVQAAVWQRGRRLSGPARQLLQLAAVAGRHADVNLLAELAGLDEATLLILLRELLSTGLVVEESADRIAFRHELTRRAVTADLLARERRAMHATLAGLIEKRHGTDVAHAAELARQFWEAEVWSKARDFGVRAGRHAVALGAPHAAIEMFTTAVDSARRLDEAPVPEVLVARAGAYERLGEFDLARADLEDRLGLARDRGDHRDRCAALVDLGSLWTARDYTRAGDYFRRGLDVARGLGEPEVAAAALNRVGNWHLNSERPELALRHHREALDLYASVGDPAGTAATLDLLGTVELTIGDLAAATRCYRDAIGHFRVLGDTPALASSLGMAIFAAPQYLGSPGTWEGGVTCEEATTGARESIAICAALGWGAGRALGHLGLASVLGQHGRYREAFAEAERGLALAEEVEHPYWTLLAHLIRGALHLDVLDAAAASRELEIAMAMATQAGSQYWRRSACGFLVDACLLGGDRLAARAVIASVAAADGPPASGAASSVSMGVRHTWRAQVELALAEGDPSTAGRIIDALRAVITATGPPSPLIELLYGRVLLALGRRYEAEAAWRLALVEAESRQVVPAAWRLHAALGRSLRATRRLDEADEHVSAARAQLTTLARAMPDDASAARFGHAAEAALPLPTTRRAAKAALGGLTAREQEVAMFVAEGHTNPEIAKHLVLSRRTVEKHVEHVLTKLGLRTRAQIAAWAVRSGLVGGPGDT